MVVETSDKYQCSYFSVLNLILRINILIGASFTRILSSFLSKKIHTLILIYFSVTTSGVGPSKRLMRTKDGRLISVTTMAPNTIGIYALKIK